MSIFSKKKNTQDFQECMLSQALWPLTFFSVFLTSLSSLRFSCRLEAWRQEHLGNNTLARMLTCMHTPTHQLCNPLQGRVNVLIDWWWCRNRDPCPDNAECRAMCIGKCSCQNHRGCCHCHGDNPLLVSVVCICFQVFSLCNVSVTPTVSFTLPQTLKLPGCQAARAQLWCGTSV